MRAVTACPNNTRAILGSYHDDNDDGDSARWDKFIGYFEGSEEGNKHAAGTMHYSSRDERWTNNNN
jgi:hypothetical protein